MLPGTEGLPARAAVQQMVTMYFISHIVRAMAELRLADHLAAGPCTITALAEVTGTHAPTLTRFIRALASLGFCETGESGDVRLTERGALLRADAPDSMRPFALAIGAPYVQRAWDVLPEAIHTGQPTFPVVHGMGFWEYLSARKEEGTRFDGAMSGAVVLRAQALLTARDLSGIGTVVDVGGGQGRMLATLLAATPGLRGVLADRSDVLAGAEAVLATAGVEDRCSLVPTDFFDSVPGGGDACVLAQIIHDWPDSDAIAILRVCHQAMPEGARLWIVEQVVKPGDVYDRAKLLDIHMLVLFGAQERTEEEYRALLEGVGFRNVTVFTSDTTWSVIEAIRA